MVEADLFKEVVSVRRVHQTKIGAILKREEKAESTLVVRDMCGERVLVLLREAYKVNEQVADVTASRDIRADVNN